MAPVLAVTAITPTASLKRSLALTTGVCQALSAGPQLVDSTDHSGARLPATGGNHPQHRCRLLCECLCSTGPGRRAQRPERSQQAPQPPYVFIPHKQSLGRASQGGPPCPGRPAMAQPAHCLGVTQAGRRCSTSWDPRLCARPLRAATSHCLGHAPTHKPPALDRRLLTPMLAVGTAPQPLESRVGTFFFKKKSMHSERAKLSSWHRQLWAGAHKKRPMTADHGCTGGVPNPLSNHLERGHLCLGPTPIPLRRCHSTCTRRHCSIPVAIEQNFVACKTQANSSTCRLFPRRGQPWGHTAEDQGIHNCHKKKLASGFCGLQTGCRLTGGREPKAVGGNPRRHTRCRWGGGP